MVIFRKKCFSGFFFFKLIQWLNSASNGEPASLMQCTWLVWNKTDKILNSKMRFKVWRGWLESLMFSSWKWCVMGMGIALYEYPVRTNKILRLHFHSSSKCLFDEKDTHYMQKIHMQEKISQKESQYSLLIFLRELSQ